MKFCLLIQFVNFNKYICQLGQRHDECKNLSRAWFRSTDLWVMGPARFHCATLLFLQPNPIPHQHNLQLPPPQLKLRKPPDFRANFHSTIQSFNSCSTWRFWSPSQKHCSSLSSLRVGAPVPHPLLKVRSGQNWTSYSARLLPPGLQLVSRGRSSDGRALA